MAFILSKTISGVRQVLFTTSRRQLSLKIFPKPRRQLVLLGAAAVTLSAGFATQAHVLHLDATDLAPPDDTRADPATSISFPTKLQIPSPRKLPDFTLVGLGVRTVSFLGIKVYSVGFYADLSNPSLSIPKTAIPDEKIEHIIRNTACILRIVPTRSTSYSHLRDGFMRALQSRIRLGKERGTLTEEVDAAIQSPLRKLKSIFPTTPLAKGVPLDVYLTAPDSSRSRALVFRDIGAIEDTWVAEQFTLAYFEGTGISPPLKESVREHLKDFGV